MQTTCFKYFQSQTPNYTQLLQCSSVFLYINKYQNVVKNNSIYYTPCTDYQYNKMKFYGRRQI